MKSFIKIVIKVIVWTLIISFISFAGFIIYISVIDYKPKPIEVIAENSDFTTLETDTFSLLNWNIGYAGLGKEMDFFYDGGKGVRPSKELHDKYFGDILSFIKTNDSVDFWLIQEVDKRAKRSYYTDEVTALEKLNKDSFVVYATNYKVPFVPIPITSPMGYVDAGLMVFSDFIPKTVTRNAYPLIANWPQKLFLLDRCFTVSKYPVQEGNYLVVINTHNSAYVYDSVKRVRELAVLQKTILDEYNRGNYVIVGGDWNQNPPGYNPSGDYNGHKFAPSKVKMNPNFVPESWKWAYDNSAPSNRKNYAPFQHGVNSTTCLDYYLVSPNMDILEVKVFDLMFENSDHNPVYLKIKLNK